MARLFERAGAGRVLSDEHVIIRVEDGVPWVYGTPWCGEGRMAGPGRARPRRVFFLRHGQRNELSAQSPGQGAARLAACCFLPFHDASALDAATAVLDGIARACSFDDFAFVPDETAVEHALAARR